MVMELVCTRCEDQVEEYPEDRLKNNRLRLCENCERVTVFTCRED